MREYSCDFCNQPMIENLMYDTTHHHYSHRGININNIGKIDFTLNDEDGKYSKKDICPKCVVVEIIKAMENCRNNLE